MAFNVPAEQDHDISGLKEGTRSFGHLVKSREWFKNIILKYERYRRQKSS